MLHYAGTVVYTIAGFLDKNRDVIQDQLFEYMRNSTVAFIRSVTKFQNMLDAERKTIMASKMRRTGASSGDVTGGTSKVRAPSVALKKNLPNSRRSSPR